MVQEEPITFYHIELETDASGNASITTSLLNGELLAIAYTKGTVTQDTTATVQSKQPFLVTLDSYNVNSGNALRFPRAAVIGTTDSFAKYPIVGNVNVTVSSGQSNRIFSVYLYII